jgi:hypothetical protein
MIAREFTNTSCRDFRAIVNLFTSGTACNVTGSRNHHAMSRSDRSHGGDGSALVPFWAHAHH